VGIRKEVLKSVVFFGKLAPPADPNSRESSEVAYGGTGFLVSYDEDGQTYRYLVTCRHVAEQLDQPFFIRANTVDGGNKEISIPDACWQYHPDSTVDVAATAFALNANVYDHLTMPLSLVVNPSKVACGDRIHIIGLFRLHYGKQRNIPIVHTGHVAALADPQEKVGIHNRQTGERIFVESYLVEAQTLEGLSGSPVLIQQVVRVKTVRRESTGADVKIGGFAPMKLLGVYQGAWDGRPGVILAADRGLRGDRRAPLGMGMVVPIERVIELIRDSETLKDWRTGMRKNKKKGEPVG
jgi:hypothetical protein